MPSSGDDSVYSLESGVLDNNNTSALSSPFSQDVTELSKTHDAPISISPTRETQRSALVHDNLSKNSSSKIDLIISTLTQLSNIYRIYK